MTHTYRLVVACCFATISFLAFAGEPRQELQPHTVKFSGDKLPLNHALKELQEQTGNLLKDTRNFRKDPILTLKAGTFWPTLDAICAQTGTGYSAYQDGGGVALDDRSYRKLQTHYSSVFRFAVKHIEVSRDEETQSHRCRVTLDTAWEPRFRALYVNLEKAEVGIGGATEDLVRQAALAVAGTNATEEIKLHMKAPARSVAKIDSLKGTIRVIGVPKMLEFGFVNPSAAPAAIEQEGVKVSLPYVKRSPKRWTVDVLIVYPEGAITPALESFQQTWRGNNRVWLMWIDPKTNAKRELEPANPLTEELAAGTKIRCEFTPRGDTPLPPMGAAVTLRYRTPNRVVLFTVPFAFQNLRLP